MKKCLLARWVAGVEGQKELSFCSLFLSRACCELHLHSCLVSQKNRKAQSKHGAELVPRNPSTAVHSEEQTKDGFWSLVLMAIIYLETRDYSTACLKKGLREVDPTLEVYLVTPSCGYTNTFLSLNICISFVSQGRGMIFSPACSLEYVLSCSIFD